MPDNTPSLVDGPGDDAYGRLIKAMAAVSPTAPGAAHRPITERPHQDAAHELARALYDIDRAVLAGLTPEQRLEECDARHALYRYATALWESPKWRGEAPTASAEYDPVAGLVDLTAQLAGNADDAIVIARDPDPDDG